MRDYVFSKICFDVQRNKVLADRLKSDLESVLREYDLKPEVSEAIRQRDLPYLSHLTNPVLLRYFFFFLGMSEGEFVERMQAAAKNIGGDRG